MAAIGPWAAASTSRNSLKLHVPIRRNRSMLLGGGCLESGMAKLQTILAAFLVSSAIGGAVFAQSATPITNRDVVGEWTLAVTPAERRGFSITFESADGGPFELPLTITAGTGGPLTCALRSDPAECRIEDGELVVVMPTRSGGARMTFTLTDRTRAGFSGAARVRVRLLPMFGGNVGSVNMARR